MLLLPHAEAMFFVDDDEAQVFELDIGLDEFVRADDQINGARFKSGHGRLHFLRRAESREFFNANRPRREAILERVVVLLGE